MSDPLQHVYSMGAVLMIAAGAVLAVDALLIGRPDAAVFAVMIGLVFSGIFFAVSKAVRLA